MNLAVREHGNLEGYRRKGAHLRLEKRGNLKWKPRGEKVENKNYLKWNEGQKRWLQSLINSGSKSEEEMKNETKSRTGTWKREREKKDAGEKEAQ